MFAKIMLAIVSLIAVFSVSECQVIYPGASAYYPTAYAAGYDAVYSPYAYGYAAAAYPSYYAWGSNKGKPSGAAPVPAPSAQSLTNNQ